MAATPVISRLLSCSVSCANKAGEIIRNILHGGDLGIVMKGSNDPQTEADRQAQRCIITSLSRKFPNVTIVGEEDLSDSTADETPFLVTEECSEVLQKTCPPEYVSLEEKQLAVWVDPVDGTKEYTEGFITHVTVLIGISVDGAPVAGVIHQPFNVDKGPGRTVWGMVGLGIFGHTPISLPRTTNPGFVVTVTRSHFNQLVQDTLDAIKPDEILREGGAGNKFLKVIEGHADAYVFPTKGTKKWDTCAGEALLKIMGGTTTDCVGDPIRYLTSESVHNFRGLLAMMHGHKEMLEKIPAEVKQKLSSLQK